MNQPSTRPHGFLDVLSIGHGHLSFKFDKHDAEQVAKAKKVLTDMLKRGYMLFIEVDGKQQRVRKFDPEREEYILEEPDVIPEPEEPVEPRRRHGSGRGRRVPMRHGKATAVGPIAGG